MTDSPAIPGTLVLVVGPSGVGKDSLIAYCRQRLPAEDRTSFPTRVITRPHDDTLENHAAVGAEEFDRLASSGEFALHWRAHGHGYGIPIVIDEDLAAGRNVVVNVSRAVIGTARRRYGPIVIISVTASRAVLAARLRGRGRETERDVRRRLGRAGRFGVGGADVVTIDDSGPLDRGGELFLGFFAPAIGASTVGRKHRKRERVGRRAGIDEKK